MNEMLVTALPGTAGCG